ncbi:nitroreductase family protein [Romboutsia sp.]|uniref:nitroreductase family protein n=1 Tax=Romboutsia sp. TaxID=1965302 RepID=UPI002BA987EB|nr:nitroreductase family protein [Romboutsia sp.]HSQ89405.1 nitroreductase family protein [Romboutsia sp.]
MNSIFKRRSIRKFTETPVTEEQIQQLLRAAMAAPSAHNKQPWEFVLTTKRETLDKLADNHPYAKMLKQAPLCIVVCANPSKQEEEGFYVQDCSAAIQNILIEAVEINLGTVWIGLHPHENLQNQVREIFNMPSDIVPISMIAIGNPDEEKHEITRYKEEIIHREIY